MVASLSCAFGSSNVNSGVGVGFSRTTSSGSGSPGSRRILALAVSLWLAGAALAGLPGLRLDSLADAGYARTGCCGGANTVQSSRSEEHTSELQSLMRMSYAVFCLKKHTHLKYTQHPSSITETRTTLSLQPTSDLLHTTHNIT